MATKKTFISSVGAKSQGRYSYYNMTFPPLQAAKSFSWHLRCSKEYWIHELRNKS